jgi:hypothetical protein
VPSGGERLQRWCALSALLRIGVDVLSRPPGASPAMRGGNDWGKEEEERK